MTPFLPVPLERHGTPRGRITLTTGQRFIVLKLADIIWIEARGHQVQVHTARGSERYRVSLKELGGQLSPEDFLHIHRSILVNRQHVVEIRAKSHGDGALVLTSGEVLTLSRTRRAGILPRIIGAVRVG